MYVCTHYETRFAVCATVFSVRGGGVGGNDVGVLPHLKTVQKPKTVPIIVRERRWKHENKK